MRQRVICMDSRNKDKNVYRRLIKAIKNSETSEEFQINFDKLLCAFIIPILFFSSLSVMLVSPFVGHKSFVKTLIDYFVLTSMGLTAVYIYSDKTKAKVRHILIAVLFNIELLYSIIMFYPDAGPSLWIFAFILIILSLAQTSKTMLYSTIGTMLIGSGITIYYHSIMEFELDIHYTYTQFSLLIILFIIARLIFQININHIQTIKRQVAELKKEISIRKKFQEKNEYMQQYDMLTGLPNKTHFTERLSTAIEYSKENGWELHLLFIDIDMFKLINDTMGHNIGDKFLVNISERLKKFKNKKTEMCRISGDEFLIMCVDSNDSTTEILALEILKSIAEPYLIEDNKINSSCCIGIAKFPDDATNAGALIKRADIAMSKAKQQGTNHYEIYSQDMEQMRFEELEIMGLLQNAILNNEFKLYYQPQVNGVTKEITGMEALIRWQHPTNGIISAGRFIPIAEKTGLIVDIGEWVLETACRQNKKWQDEGKDIVPVAVNISVNQIKENYLFDLVNRVLKKTGLDPKYLELEITESILAAETNVIIRNLQKVRDLGVKIAIDDFGTGYSAMEYLRQFPTDRIKIPMNFVHGIGHNNKDESIINVILALSQGFGIDVLAEGVESEEQLEFLIDRMCYTIQGYYFYKPMDAEAMFSLLVDKEKTSNVLKMIRKL